MYPLDKTDAKMCAEKAYYGDQQTAQCAAPDPSYGSGLCGSSEPPTLRREAEKKVGYHRSQAEKHDQAAAFFRENPAFDQFIRLIRSGVIRF